MACCGMYSETPARTRPDSVEIGTYRREAAEIPQKGAREAAEMPQRGQDLEGLRAPAPGTRFGHPLRKPALDTRSGHPPWASAPGSLSGQPLRAPTPDTHSGLRAAAPGTQSGHA